MPTCSVVILTHENKNHAYLHNCLKSLGLQEGVELEVIVVSSCVEPITAPSWVKVVQIDHSVPGPKALNYGVSLTDTRTKYLMLANDDVIFSKHAIREMCEIAGDYKVMINPKSNCDSGWQYHAEIDLYNEAGTKLDVKRFMTYDEVFGYEDAIMNYPLTNQRVHLAVEQLCMYATLVPRAVWDELGPTDERYINSYADTDYSLRARQHNVTLLIALSAFVWHYGGATTKEGMTTPQRIQDQELFKSVWGERA